MRLPATYRSLRSPLFDSGETSATKFSSSRISVSLTKGARADRSVIVSCLRSSFSSARSPDRSERSEPLRPMFVSPNSVRPVRPATWDRFEIWVSLTYSFPRPALDATETGAAKGLPPA